MIHFIILVQSQEKFDFPSGTALLWPFKETRVLTITLYPRDPGVAGDFDVQLLQLCWPRPSDYFVPSFLLIFVFYVPCCKLLSSFVELRGWESWRRGGWRGDGDNLLSISPQGSGHRHHFKNQRGKGVGAAVNSSFSLQGRAAPPTAPAGSAQPPLWVPGPRGGGDAPAHSSHPR